MADWFAFVLAIGEEFLVWLSSMSLLGTSLRLIKYLEQNTNDKETNNETT